jgi:hypothetical protein
MSLTFNTRKLSEAFKIPEGSIQLEIGTCYTFQQANSGTGGTTVSLTSEPSAIGGFQEERVNRETLDAIANFK